jgi:acetolactate synthase-1/2/3 large subunit
VPSSQIGRLRGQLHELPDQLATLRTLVRHADRIEDPTEAPRKVARAFQEMLSGRPGPVALEVPLDQLPAEAEVTPCDPLPLHPAPAPDPAKIARLADMIDAARNPMIWVGAGAMDAGPEIRALAEKIGAPVVRYRGGRGVLDDRHPLSLTVPEGYRLWPETDLLIGIGTRLDVPTARWGKLPDGVRIARIDIDPAEFRRLSVDLGIVADAADATRALTQAVARRDDPGRAARIARAKAEVAAEIQSVQPQMSFLEAIRDALPEDGIFCDEMTQVGYVSAFGMPFHAPRTAIGSGFSGNLGAGFPTALGVKVAHPGRAVVAVTGDGGFLFGGSDLATAVRYGINLVTVLFNNNSYGNVLRDQRRLYDGRHCGAELTNPDFQTYAKAFGVRSWRVTDAAGLRSALGEALVTNAPCLIEVMTDITKEPSPFRFLAPHRP